MTEATHALIRRFFTDLGNGALDEAMFTDDHAAWTINTHAEVPGAVYRGGARLLASLFREGPVYTIKAITAEGDRASAEVSAEGVLSTGETYRNDYCFTFRLRDGRIAHSAEYFDVRPVEQQIMPLLIAAMNAAPTGA